MNAAAAAAMASAGGRNSCAAAVGNKPDCERVNNTRPPMNSCSSAMCLPTVGWVNPKDRPAADRLPSRRTARNERYRSQPGSVIAMHLCITDLREYAISFSAPACNNGRNKGVEHAKHISSRSGHRDHRQYRQRSRRGAHGPRLAGTGAASQSHCGRGIGLSAQSRPMDRGRCHAIERCGPGGARHLTRRACGKSA